jgi:Carboxypeptidase regulatory-like domain/TonB dependent receptor-like, beta-barrel
MARAVPVVVAFAVCLVVVDSVTAQTLFRIPEPIARNASVAGGRVQGIVRDDRGLAVAGVSIVAMGATLATARSDALGKFALALAPGDYVLRATRDGYISTYREAVRIQTAALVEREITLFRPDTPEAVRSALIAAVGRTPGHTGVTTAPDLSGDDHAHSETAWRLRHLPRSVLRDGEGSAGTFTATKEFKPSTTIVESALQESARAAASYFTETDFSGQLNLVTTSAASAGSRSLPIAAPRGIAYVSVGAPLGSGGDWRIRGTMAGGDLSSWAMLGEYQASRDRTHAVALGVSYSVQGYVAGRTGPRSIEPGESRSVGGAYLFDRWRLGRGASVEYGFRLDRYDYTAPHLLLSPRIGARAQVLPRFFVSARGSQRMVAPGADEFLPPASAGLWLPPERTFSTLTPGAPFRVERVRHLEFALEREFGAPDAPRTFGVAHFRQEAENQLATLFGLDEASAVGHYYVATPGTVSIEAWQVRVGGQLASGLRGTIGYAVVDANWIRGRYSRTVVFRAPSVIRPDRERLHDFTATLDASLAESTQLTIDYRFDNVFSRLRRDGRRPAPGHRFVVLLHQALPYQPIRDGRLEAVFSMRTMFREDEDIRAFYDELLTVAPPLRLMGGVQVKF